MQSRHSVLLLLLLFLKEKTAREENDSWSPLLGFVPRHTQFPNNWLNVLNPCRSLKFRNCNTGSWTNVTLIPSAIRSALAPDPPQNSRGEAVSVQGNGGGKRVIPEALEKAERWAPCENFPWNTVHITSQE